MREYKNINEKKERVCYLIETDKKKYLEFIEKKNVETEKAIWRKQQGFISDRELSKEEILNYKENNYEGLGKKND